MNEALGRLLQEYNATKQAIDTLKQVIAKNESLHTILERLEVQASVLAERISGRG